MYKIIALMGEAGTGKDTIQNALIAVADKQNIPIHKIISCTTRPPRDYETNTDYHFLSNDKFAEKVLNGDMLEATSFNGWFYGTSIDSLEENKINVGVFNPDGVRALQYDSRVKVYCFHLVVSDKERLIRQLNREKSPDIDEIIRRYKADKEDFNNLELSDINNKHTLDNEKTSIQDVVGFILEFIQNIGQD